MFCPECKCEYEADYTVCSDCNIDLVEVLPTPMKKGKSLPKRYTFFIILNLVFGILGGLFLGIVFGVMITNAYQHGNNTVWLVLIGLYIAIMSYINFRCSVIYCKIAEAKFFSIKGITRFLLTLLCLLVCIVIGFIVMSQVILIPL